MFTSVQKFKLGGVEKDVLYFLNGRRKNKVGMWELNAKYVEETFGSYVDWEDRFYICPDCDEAVYECDWSDDELGYFICPICNFTEEEGEED